MHACPQRVKPARAHATTPEPSHLDDPMDDPALQLTQRIEQASLNAWPALHQVLHDGWLLRFCGGFTKRANSVSIITRGSTPLAERIDFCESLYRHQGLAPVFRLTDRCPEPGLDDLLAARGYAHIDPTDVLAADATALAGHALTGELGRDDWLEHYTRLSGSPEQARRLHGLLLSGIRLPCRFGVVEAEGQVVACGLAVHEADLVGLFDIVTDAAHRGRGHGERLTAGLVAWGAGAGARIAYLQVVAANAPAQRLYRGLGFGASHRYWYRALA
jgi:ribosomal protein S18 acetylase RimI-like enzyme